MGLVRRDGLGYNKNMQKKCLTAMILAAVLLFFPGCGSFGTKESYTEKEGFFFDTEVSFRIYGENAEKEADYCLKRCGELELVFSPTKAESELFRVNHRETDTVEVSEDLAACIDVALKLRTLSDGLFEPAIRPLAALWTEAREKGAVPPEEEIRKARELSDGSGIRLSGRTLSFRDRETMLDLGALAKGYISGLLKKELEARGVKSALLNLGGNIRVIGKKPDGKAFVIGVQKPFSDRGTLSFTAAVNDACVISSGVYERYFTQDGVRYHHILSPKTGMPADSGLLQVTVIGGNDLYADAYSTLFMLTGKEEAFRLIEREQLPGNFVFMEEDGSLTLFDASGRSTAVREGENLDLTKGGGVEEK